MFELSRFYHDKEIKNYFINLTKKYNIDYKDLFSSGSNSFLYKQDSNIIRFTIITDFSDSQFLEYLKNHENILLTTSSLDIAPEFISLEYYKVKDRIWITVEKIEYINKIIPTDFKLIFKEVKRIYNIMKKHNIFHSDLSKDNLIFTRDTPKGIRGYLIDWDSASINRLPSQILLTEGFQPPELLKLYGIRDNSNNQFFNQYFPDEEIKTIKTINDLSKSTLFSFGMILKSYDPNLKKLNKYINMLHKDFTLREL